MTHLLNANTDEQLTTPPVFLPTVDDVSNALDAAVTDQASDIVLKHNNRPKAKVHGEWQDISDLPVLTISEMEELVRMMLTEDQHNIFRQERDFDFQFTTQNYRFRVNAAYQCSGPMLTFRPIPKEPPQLEDLNFINAKGIITLLHELAIKPRGLVLVTGPTGMGKSTTLAAMVRFINENYAKNIVTIEDPIEFMHTGIKSLISQREVGNDTRSFPKALRGALRQTPDIILVGELRDPETIEAALTAAETGHLVLATLHTNNAPASITRILDVIPGDKANLIKTQLAASLIAVVTQQLVPRSDRIGKQVIVEVMLNEGSITNMIRDGENALNLYYDEMYKNESKSVLMDDQLAQAAKLGFIDPSIAQSRAIQVERFNKIFSQTRVEAAAVPSTASASRTGWNKK